MADERMTLTERLRNPEFRDPGILTGVVLDTKPTRETMDEAARALDDARAHIDTLCRFAMDNENWVKASQAAAAFIASVK